MAMPPPALCGRGRRRLGRVTSTPAPASRGSSGVIRLLDLREVALDPAEVLAAVDDRVLKVQIWLSNGDMTLASL